MEEMAMDKLKVLMVNGSPHEKGCVFTVLTEIADTLRKNDVDSDIFWIGNKPLAGCMGCGTCIGKRRCFCDDTVNDFINRMDGYNGFIFGTPVHYAAASGTMTSFMNRTFFIDEFNGDHFAGKPAAAIATCRRSGATATLDQMNKYMADCNMPIVPSQYWNVAHGNTPEEIRQDAEGMQTMRVLGDNMAWLLKCIRLGREANVNFPKQDAHIMTNFIRKQEQNL